MKKKLLLGILILIVLAFFGKEMFTEWRINRGIKKMYHQAPKTPYDLSSQIKMKALLKSTFQDKLSLDCLLKLKMVWNNHTWLLTTIVCDEHCLSESDVINIFNDSLAPVMPPAADPIPQGWFATQTCEIIRMGEQFDVVVNYGLIDTMSQNPEYKPLNPLRDFGYPVGQRPQEDVLQKELIQQEIYLDEKDMQAPLLGKMIITKDPSQSKVTVDVTFPQIKNPALEKGLEKSLTTFYQQQLNAYDPSITFSTKDAFGEVKKKFKSSAIIRDYNWLIRIPHEDGALYYSEPREERLGM